MTGEVFEIGDTGVALPVRLAQRVELIDEIVPVPGSPPPIIGIAEAGGGIVTLIDPTHWCAESGRLDLLPRGALHVLTLAPPFANLALLLGRQLRLQRSSSSEKVILDESRFSALFGCVAGPCL